jgi:hypothetical protein
MGRHALNIGCTGALLIALAAASSCAHTMPAVRRSELAARAKPWCVGVAGFYDVHQFDHAPRVAQALRDSGAFSRVVLTHRLDDPACDFVLRGNLVYYRVDTRNGFHRFSIYFLTLPLLTGIPNHHLDGMCLAGFEIYRQGELLRARDYRDVFWAERSYLTALVPAPGLAHEITRVTRRFVRDWLVEADGPKGGS